jgi:hypothetical protein
MFSVLVEFKSLLVVFLFVMQNSRKQNLLRGNKICGRLCFCL